MKGNWMSTDSLTGRALLDHLYGLHTIGRPLPSIAGGAPEDVAPAAPAPTADTAAPVPAVPADFIAEMNALKTELASHRADRQAREQAAQKAERETLLAKGQLDQIAANHAAALAAKDDALAALDKRTRSSELRRSLTEALSGHELREGAMGQLLKLWGDEFQVDDDGEGFKVRSKADLRDPKSVFAERLQSKEYDHFLRAGHKGGAATAIAQGTAAVAPNSNPFLASVDFLRKQTEALRARHADGSTA